MDPTERRRRVRRDRITDLGIAAWGAAPTAFSGVDVDKVRSPESIVTGPAGKLVGEAKKGWKATQDALGEGSRKAGFEDASKLLAKVSADGRLSPDAAEGAKDALLGTQRTRTTKDYMRAYRSLSRLQRQVPVEHATYPRMEDGYRGGVIAATAVEYAAATGRPMLSRVQRAVLSSRTAKWNPGSVVFGSGASLAGSTLDAVKHITESATDDADAASNQVGEGTASVEKWLSLLQQLGAKANSRGPEDAVVAARRAIDHAGDAVRLVHDASLELKTWERDL